MADTASYYQAAYIVAGVLYVLYAASLVTRARKVAARMEALERGESER
jgi:hypothetical protein